MASCSTPIYFTSEKCQASKKRNKVVADRASSCVCIVASCQNAARPWEKSVEGSNLMLLAVTSGLAEDASSIGSRHGHGQDRAHGGHEAKVHVFDFSCCIDSFSVRYRSKL